MVDMGITTITINGGVGKVLLDEVEDLHARMYRQFVNKAHDQCYDRPEVLWIFSYGGDFESEQESYVHGDDEDGTRQHRAGIQVTFKERDKAMLFKLMFMGREEAPPLAFAA